MVADVDELLEAVERLFPHAVEGDHGLQGGAVALAQRHEHQLARAPPEDDASGDRDDVAGVVVGAERLGVVRVAHLRDRVRDPQVDRVGLDARVDELLPLLATDPQLLGQVVDRVLVGGPGGVAHGTIA